MTERIKRWFVMACFALIVCLRMPAIIGGGRFWAEEGSHFFVNAWEMPPLRALLTPFGGYLNIVASAATILARWTLPLAYAPYATITVGLFFQLLPPFVVLTAADPWLRSWRIRLTAVLLILFVANSDEIWLQTLHCQFELTLAAGLVLALDTPPLRSPASAGRLAALALAPLCGPGAFALVPLFLARAVIERSAERAAQFAAIAGASLVQVLLFFTSMPGRSNALHPVLYLCMVTVRHLAVPFLGMAHGQIVADGIRATLAGGHLPLLAIILPLAAFAVLGAEATVAGIRKPAIWLFLGAAAVSTVSFYGAIGGGLDMVSAYFGERYVFVPQVLLSLGILALLATGPQKRSGLYRLACVWLLVIGVSGYFFPWPFIAEGPAWRPQIAAWRADPHTLLHAWPASTVLSLSPQ